MNKNSAISLSRVTGMIMIILCHIIKYYSFIPGHNILPEFFGCGVQLFLFISGYLYSGKIINNFKQWYTARVLTVSLPTIVISFFTIIVLLICGEAISIPSIITYLLDAEGLLFLNWDLFSRFFSEIPSLGPLWYTTIIMLCYALVPLLQRITSNTHKNNYFTVMLLTIGLITSIALVSYCNIMYFWLFCIGYCFGKRKVLDKINTGSFFLYTGILFVFMTGRIIMRIYLDNTPLYYAYVPLSQCVIGTWIVVFFAFIQNLSHAKLSKLAAAKITRILDDYSFYVYLVHGLLCMGFFNLYERISLPIATVLFILGTILLAFALKHLSDWMKKLIPFPKKQNNQ